MKTLYTAFITLLICITSCTNIYQHTVEEQILNDVFLQVVDTVAYKYHSLRPPLPLRLGNSDTFQSDTATNDITQTNRKLFIAVSDTLINLKNWQLNLNAYFDEHPEYNSYRTIINNKLVNDRDENIIKPSAITNTGKFTLISNNKKIDDAGILCGAVELSNVAYNTALTKAALLVTISASNKVGLTKLVLLSKKTNWKIVKESIFQIW